MKKMLLVILVTVVAFSASAQRFGLKGGVNLANYYGSDADGAKMLVGFNVGGLVELPLSGGFFLQPELLLSMKGAKVPSAISGVESLSLKPFYLDIPVKIMYKLDAGTGKLGLAVGPYVGFGIAGKATASSGSVDASVDLFSKIEGADQAFLKRFDAGLASSISYELQSGLFFALDSNLGLVSVANGGSLKNTVISLGLGYKF